MPLVRSLAAIRCRCFSDELCYTEVMRSIGCLLLLLWSQSVLGELDTLSSAIVVQVKAAVEERFPEATVAVTVPKLAPFIRQRPCAEPSITLKGQQLLHRIAVELRCNEQHSWSAYVTASVSAHQAIPTLCRALSRGHRMRATDLCLREEDLATLAPLSLTTADAIVGRETRRALPVGTVLQTASLTAPRLIRRGETVQLEAGTGTIRIRTRASATNDGRYGEQITVINLSSSKRVQAWVVGQGRVSTRPPP